MDANERRASTATATIQCCCSGELEISKNIVAVRAIFCLFCAATSKLFFALVVQLQSSRELVDQLCDDEL